MGTRLWEYRNSSHHRSYRVPIEGSLPRGWHEERRLSALKKQSSMYTFLLYLNDEFEGGETTFFMPAPREGTYRMAAKLRRCDNDIRLRERTCTHGSGD
jgi:hypothetical protein